MSWDGFGFNISDVLNNPIIKGLGKATEIAIKAGIETNAETKAKAFENKTPPKSTIELNTEKGEMIPEKMKEAGKLSSDYGGCVFGKLNGSYFGKSAEKDGHILVVGGSGSGKSTCFAIPTISNWKQSKFCIDIKGELYKNSIHKGKVLDPCSISGAKLRYGYDPFYLLKKARNKSKEAYALACAIIPLLPDNDNPFWTTSSQNLLTSAILHYSSLNYTFVQTMKKLTSRPIIDSIVDIHDNSPKESIVKDYISAFVGMADKTLSGIYGELHRNIILFTTDEDIINCLNADIKLSPEDLMTTSIYICIPDEVLDEWNNFLCLIITQFTRYFRNLPERGEKRFLFLIDEFARIGKLDGIKNALATLRSKNVTMCLLVQSLAQLDDIYGEKQRQVIVDNCIYKVIFNASDADTQEYFSRIIGTYDKYKKITGRQYEILTNLPSGRNISVTTEEKRIIKPEEFATLDDVVVTTPEGFFRIEKTPYHKDHEYAKAKAIELAKAKSNEEIMTKALELLKAKSIEETMTKTLEETEAKHMPLGDIPNPADWKPLVTRLNERRRKREESKTTAKEDTK